MSNCPACDAPISIAADARASEIITCPDCQAELEIVSVAPPDLALAPELEEDWGE